MRKRLLASVSAFTIGSALLAGCAAQPSAEQAIVDPTVTAQSSTSPSAGASAGASPSAPSPSASASTSRGASAASSAVLPPPGDSNLIFSSDFSGSTLNTSTWATCYPWASSGNGCTNFGNNDEYEWYEASQDTVNDGVLAITAAKEATEGTDKDGNPKTYDCRSGMVTSLPRLNFEYGYIQVVAQIPYGTGLWPAIWLAASNGQWPPEMDMLEHWGTTSLYKMYWHPYPEGSAVGEAQSSTPNLADGWHTFGLNWTPTSITWYLDGQKMLTETSNIPHQDMYFVADLADYRNPETVGGCSGSLLIKSIKVWQ
jgi:beta-glucanase (GH16 family)